MKSGILLVVQILPFLGLMLGGIFSSAPLGLVDVAALFSVVVALLLYTLIKMRWLEFQQLGFWLFAPTVCFFIILACGAFNASYF